MLRIVNFADQLLVLVFYLVNILKVIQEGNLVESQVFVLWAVVIVVIITVVGIILTTIMISIIRAIKTGKVE